MKYTIFIAGVWILKYKAISRFHFICKNNEIPCRNDMPHFQISNLFWIDINKIALPELERSLTSVYQLCQYFP